MWLAEEKAGQKQQAASPLRPREERGSGISAGTGSPVPGTGADSGGSGSAGAPRPQGPFPAASLDPWLSREPDVVVGKHLYSADVPRSPGQEREAGAVSAAGAAAQSQSGDRSTVLLLVWLEMAHLGVGVTWSAPLLTQGVKAAASQRGGGTLGPAPALGSGL